MLQVPQVFPTTQLLHLILTKRSPTLYTAKLPGVINYSEDITWYSYYAQTQYLKEIHKQNMMLYEKLNSGKITVVTKTGLKPKKELQSLGLSLELY